MPDNPTPQVDYSQEQVRTAMPLFDQVKLEIFNKYAEANRRLAQITQGKDYNWTYFKGLVFAIYIDIRPKLEAMKEDAPSDYEKLELDMLPAIIEKHLSNPASLQAMPNDLAVKAFILERIFLEKNGITRYERQDDGNWR